MKTLIDSKMHFRQLFLLSGRSLELVVMTNKFSMPELRICSEFAALQPHAVTRLRSRQLRHRLGETITH